jgi:hypothetical protein
MVDREFTGFEPSTTILTSVVIAPQNVVFDRAAHPAALGLAPSCEPVFHENSIATKAPLIVAADENAGRFLDYIALRGPPLVDSRIYHRCQLLQRSTSGTGSI